MGKVLGFFMILGSLTAFSADSFGSDVYTWLKYSQVLKGVKAGIEVEYQVKCQDFILKSYTKDPSGASFVVTATCLDPVSESGIILTVDGAAVDGSQVIISNIRVDFAG